MRAWKHPVIMILATVLVTSLLSGCVTPASESLSSSGVDASLNATWEARLSAPVFDEVIHQEVEVRAHDNQRLNVDVFRPDPDTGAEDGRVPVILVYSPYFELSKGTDGKPWGFLGWMVDHFAPRGYAVAFADARGSRESGGCIDVAGPKEVADGARVVEHLAHEPWSTGKVGMFGVSYPARTQYGIATLNPEGLETIVPVAGISDYYTYLYHDGVPREGNNPGTYAGYHGISAIPHASAEGAQAYPQRFGCVPENMEHGLDLTGEWDGYWEARDYNKDVANVTAALWFVHGFEDWNVLPVSAVEYYERADVEKRMWFLQMEHNYPQWNTYQPAWSRPDFPQELHRWYDHHLKGKDMGLSEEAPVQVQDSSGRWRTAEAWPPTNATRTTFQLHANGTLAPGPAEEGEVTYAVLPSTGWPRTEVWYTSDPLREPLHIAGVPELHLNVSLVDGDSTHVGWWLEAVSPSGEATLLDRGYMDTRFRNGVRTGAEAAEMGETLHMPVSSQPQDDVVPTGYELRVRVMGDDGWVFHDERPTAASLVTVHHGGDAPSTLVLPTVTPSEDAFMEPPQGWTWSTDGS